MSERIRRGAEMVALAKQKSAWWLEDIEKEMIQLMEPGMGPE